MDNLDPDFTVEENLLVYGRYFGLRRAHESASVSRALLRVRRPRRALPAARAARAIRSFRAE